MPIVLIKLPENPSKPRGHCLLDVLKNSGESIQHKCDARAQMRQLPHLCQGGRKTSPKLAHRNEKLDSIVGVGSKSRTGLPGNAGTKYQ